MVAPGGHGSRTKGRGALLGQAAGKGGSLEGGKVSGRAGQVGGLGVLSWPAPTHSQD